MPSFLNKLLAATGLTRSGRLMDATAAIQRALAGEAPASAPHAAREPAAVAATAGGGGEVLDGLVRERHDTDAPSAAGSVKPALASGPSSAESVLPDAVAATGAPVEAAPAEPSQRDAMPADAAPAAVPPRVEMPAAGHFVASSFTGATGTRSFKLFEPGGFDGRALPLVVMLHGCTQDPDDFAAGTRMNALAQAQGLLVLYPAQAPRSNAHKCWNWFVPADQRRGSGEPALIAGMVRHVMQTHTVDPDRVYVAGLSAGGAMAAILAREYPDLFAAAGVHSGLPAGAAHDVASAFQAMKGGGATPGMAWAGVLPGGAPLRAPIASWPGLPAAQAAADAGDAALGAPLIVFHGDADPTVNPRNGHHVVDAALGPAPSEAVRESGVAGDGRAFTRIVYRLAGSAAAAPSRAEHWLVHGAAHAWSGGSGGGSYADPSGPDASREMLRFFLEHPRAAS